MKSAILISGFLRIFKETKNNHNHFLFSKLKDYDVYIHAWDKVDCQSDFDDFENEIIRLFNPKKIIIEPYFEFDISKYPNHYGRCNNVLSMFYKIKKVFELTENIHYDNYIRLRTDHFFLNGINDQLLFLAKNSNKLIFPKTNISHGVNDQFCLSNYDIMKQYSSLYDNIDVYYQEGISINPELLLSHHVKKLSINTIISNIEFTDYTYNSTFSNYQNYINDMKNRHPNILI